MAIWVPWLVDAARQAVAGTGKQVIVSPGWQSRGHGGLRVVEVVVGHHTATPESAPGDYPSLAVVRDGRAGLAGPLAQYGLGRSGNVYVIAAGLCYHAGASAFAGFVDLNDESIGIEAEDSGDGVWTPDQLLIYPRLVRACLDYIRRGVDRYASHRTVAVPAGRKNDPAGISDQWMRQQAASVQQQEEDMTPEQAGQLTTLVNQFYLSKQTPGGETVYDALWKNRAMLAAILAAQQDDLHATEVLAHLDAGIAQLKQELHDSISADLAAIKAAVDTQNADEVTRILDEMGKRLRPAA